LVVHCFSCCPLSLSPPRLPHPQGACDRQLCSFLAILTGIFTNSNQNIHLVLSTQYWFLYFGCWGVEFCPFTAFSCCPLSLPPLQLPHPQGACDWSIDTSCVRWALCTHIVCLGLAVGPVNPIALVRTTSTNCSLGLHAGTRSAQSSCLL